MRSTARTHLGKSAAAASRLTAPLLASVESLKRYLQLKRNVRRLGLAKQRWLSFKQIRHEEVSDAIQNASAMFDEKFFEDLARRKDEIEKRYWKLTLYNFLMFIILFMNSSSIKYNVSILGISLSDVNELKEIIVVISSTLSFFAAVGYMDSRDLKVILRAKTKSNLPASLHELGERRYSDFFGSLPAFKTRAKPFHYPTKTYVLFVWTFAISAIVMAAGLIAAMIYVQVVVILDIAVRPSLPEPLSTLVVIYSAASILFWIAALILMEVPLPHRDFTLSQELVQLQERDPVEHQRRLAQLWQERVENRR